MNRKATQGNLGRMARRRTSSPRGVSPIIATILLVAITVVLAAVLYVLISGLTGSTATAPVSLAPVETGSGGSGASWNVNVGIDPTSGITTTAIGLKVTTSASTIPVSAAVAGTGCTVGTAFTVGATGCAGVAGKWYGVLENSTGSIVATYLSTGWSSSVTISGGSYTIVVISAIQFQGAGYTLTAFGTGATSVSGLVHL